MDKRVASILKREIHKKNNMVGFPAIGRWLECLKRTRFHDSLKSTNPSMGRAVGDFI